MEGVSSVQEVSQGSWEWSTDADCALCHETQAETVASSSCEISADAQYPCLPCHDDTAALHRAHELPFNRSTADRLRETEVNDSSCGDCHSENELASSTSASTALVDAEGTTVNPHALPESGDHDSISCMNCHRIHEGNPAETSPNICTSCHHQGVFACGTCHE